MIYPGVNLCHREHFNTRASKFVIFIRPKMYDFAPEYSALFPRIEDKKIKCITYIYDLKLTKYMERLNCLMCMIFMVRWYFFIEAPRAQFDN